MMCLSNIAGSKQAFVLVALTMSVVANASLLDCSNGLGVGLNPGVECAPDRAPTNINFTHVLNEPTPAASPATNFVTTGFHVNQPRSSGALPGSTPLIGLVCAFLGVVLLRAKSFNTK